jgi:hypothetical protein
LLTEKSLSIVSSFLSWFWHFCCVKGVLKGFGWYFGCSMF